MTREEIETKLKDVIVSALDLEDLSAADIATDVPLFGEGLGLDSIDALELVSLMYDQWGVDVPTEDMKKLTTVNSIADYIRAAQ